MEERSWKINYIAYQNKGECPDTLQSEIAQSVSALAGSYAPYSKFHVGAALLLEDGTHLLGSNQENASYPLGLCAERTALSAKASLAPDKKITSIAITVKSLLKTVDTPAAPCGICRQVLLESEQKQHQNIQVILTGETGEVLVFNSIKDLMPFFFGPDDL
jgi:cytidine deaminase